MGGRHTPWPGLRRLELGGIGVVIIECYGVFSKGISFLQSALSVCYTLGYFSPRLQSPPIDVCRPAAPCPAQSFVLGAHCLLAFMFRQPSSIIAVPCGAAILCIVWARLRLNFVHSNVVYSISSYYILSQFE